MADIEDDVKTTNKYMENESFNDRSSLSGGSLNHGSASACKFQPVRVKALLDMYESDDDDSEDKDRSSDDDEAALSDFDDGQALPDADDLKCKGTIELSNAQLPSISAVDVKETKMEIITEEPERQSISRESMKNLPDYFTSTNVSSTTVITTITTMTTTTTAIKPSSITVGSDFSHQHYDMPQQIQAFAQVDNKRLSVSKELFHVDNERKLSIGKQSNSGFTSDFVAMDSNSKGVRSVEKTVDTITPFVQSNPAVSNTGQLFSRSRTFDSVGRNSDGSILSNSMFGNKHQSNMKFESGDSINSSHERHTHSLLNYKTDSAATSCSKYDVPTTSLQNDLSTMSVSYSSVQTPHKHNIVPGSMRPTTQTAHRNIFQTPHNKMQGDYLSNQSHAPTPGTIFSHWSQNNLMHTPMQNKISDTSQTPSESILSKHELAWYRNKETKGARRPLAETTASEHRIMNEKSLHGARSHDSIEVSNRLPLEKIQEKVPMQSTIPQLSKENRRPLIMESVTTKDELPGRNKISETIQENRHTKPEVIQKSIPADIDPMRVHHNNPPAIQSKTNVQASVPSSIRKTEHGKTMKVKEHEYMILGYLGQGMSGEVVRVQDLSSLELRAIKCVDLSRMDKDSAQSCVHEITMLGKLQAPCIVRMFDYEIRNKMIYVVMEMGDTDLSKFLKSICAEKRLPLTMILYYWTEMLTAVKHIHDNGVIHSDLKPANFLLVRGRLKLIDFGIASTMNGDMTSVVKNSTVGTLNYISPEALMDVGESPNHNSKYKISYASDVWSLGCILYSLVFGHTPFQHIRQQWAKINAIVNPTSKISFTQLPNSEPIPSILIDVVRKCLQHDPKVRPSVAQLLEIRYVPIGKQSAVAPNIPSNILLKIKSSLNDDEWRQFTEIMDQERRNC